MAAWLCQLNGDRVDEAYEWAEEALQLATEFGFTEQLGHARELQRWYEADKRRRRSWIISIETNTEESDPNILGSKSWNLSL